MPFRRGGGGKRRDANEPDVIAAVREAGGECWQVSGTGLPDLIVRFRGRFYCGEVKTATGKLKKTQGAFPIWRTPDDVLDAIGATGRRCAECRHVMNGIGGMCSVEYCRCVCRSRTAT